MTKQNKKPAKSLEPEIVDRLPEELKRKLPPEVLRAISVSVSESWSAPLPPPHIFKKYPVEVRKAIVAQANSQLKHRQKIEEKVIGSNIRNASKGMNYAFWLTITMIVAGVILLLNDISTAGLIALFGGSGFQAGNFLLHKWREHNEISKDAEAENNKQVRGKQ